MTPASQLDVLVVGAGPTGLTLACQLARFGVSFRIIDKQPDRARESRALGVQARSLEVLQTLWLGRSAGRAGPNAWSKVDVLKLAEGFPDVVAINYLTREARMERSLIRAARHSGGSASITMRRT